MKPQFCGGLCVVLVRCSRWQDGRNVCFWWSITDSNIFDWQSQWPRRLRRKSAAARLLRLWVRIPPGHGCLCVVSVVCCQRSLRRANHSFIGVLPTVMRRCVWSRNLENEEAMTHSCASNKQTNIYDWNWIREGEFYGFIWYLILLYWLYRLYVCVRNYTVLW